MRILIIGATGTLGAEISKLCQNKGNTVITASRKLQPSIDIDDSKSIENYFNQVQFFDAIICVAGHASWGKLEELSDEQINLGLNSKLIGQVNIVRKGIKKLNPNGIIILTGGLLAYSPWLGTSNIAMANAGLDGFIRAIALELNEEKRIVVVHPPLIQETAIKLGMDSRPCPSASKVAETYLKTLYSQSSGQSIFVEGYEPK